MIRTRVLLAIFLLVPSAAFTQGFFVGDNGAAPSGMGGAGVAYPVDLATAIYNPAGLVRVKDGAQGSLAIVNFNHGVYYRAPDEHSNYQPYEKEELQKKTYLGGPFVAVADNLGTDKMKFAFSSVLQYGSKLVFDPDGVQRYMMKEVELFIMDQNFSAAYAIDDQWSVGGSIVWSWAQVNENIDLDLQSLIDPTVPPSELEENRIPTEVALKDNGLGFALGVLRNGDDWRFGFMYHSQVTLQLEGDVTTNLYNVPQVVKDLLGVDGDKLALDAKMTMKLPQYARIGASFRPASKLWLSGEVFWIDWSTLDAFDVQLAPNPINVTSYVIPRKWEDGWSYKFGADWKQSDKLNLRAGIFYVNAPTKAETVQLDIPDNDRVGVTMGLAYDFSGPVGLDVTYIHQFLQSWHIENSIQNPPVNGDVEVNFGTLLMGLRYTF